MKRDKNWAKNEVIKVWGRWMAGSGTIHELNNSVISIIDKLDEPSKVVVPQFVADWLKLRKKDFKSAVKAVSFLCSYGWDNNTHIDYEMAIWMERNGDEFARAWLDYPNIEVEKEPLYYTVDEKGQTLLFKSQERGVIRSNGADLETVLMVYKQNPSNMYQLTEKEIKDYDPRYWAFAVEVSE